MLRFEACFFDYGNTLVEFDHFQVSSILERLARVLTTRWELPVALWSLSPAMAQVVSRPHRGDPPSYRELDPLDQMRWFLERTVGDRVKIDSPMVAACNRDLQDFFVDVVRLERASGDYLRSLKGRIPLALVSNYSCGDAIRRSVERVGIAGLFESLVVSGDVGFVKPHAAPFEAALHQLGVSPENVLFVGDRWDIDMMGASRLGMKTCQHVGHTSDLDLASRYQQYRPDYIIERLEDLEYVLFGDRDG